MPRQHFVSRVRIPAPAEDVFAWHERPGAFERLTPPWEPVEVVERTGTIRDGDRATLRLRLGPFSGRWVAEHRDYIPNRQFRDVQLTGPFAFWEHTHRLEPLGPDACSLEDTVDYALPVGALGRLVAGAAVRRKLKRLFDYRGRIIVVDTASHLAYKGDPMKVIISGSTGTVGSALVPFLTTGGHSVTRLVRRQPKDASAAIGWDPVGGTIDTAGLEAHDAVVHLAGESIAGRWTAAKKAKIRDSRVRGTRLLAEALAALKNPPKVLVCASAVGYYGDRGDLPLTEDAGSGTGFLAETCREWEAAADPARKKGIRVVHLRIGVVLTPAGGALKEMLLPFKLGVGGRVGDGRQYYSWIALDDLIGAIHHALITPALTGPVNTVAPNPVTNAEFTKTLGRVLSRPTIFPMPAFAARLALGEMADQLLLSSARLDPGKLIASGYRFRFPDLEAALRHLLGK